MLWGLIVAIDRPPLTGLRGDLSRTERARNGVASKVLTFGEVPEAGRSSGGTRTGIRAWRERPRLENPGPPGPTRDPLPQPHPIHRIHPALPASSGRTHPSISPTHQPGEGPPDQFIPPSPSHYPPPTLSSPYIPHPPPVPQLAVRATGPVARLRRWCSRIHPTHRRRGDPRLVTPCLAETTRNPLPLLTPSQPSQSLPDGGHLGSQSQRDPPRPPPHPRNRCLMSPRGSSPPSKSRSPLAHMAARHSTTPTTLDAITISLRRVSMRLTPPRSTIMDSRATGSDQSDSLAIRCISPIPPPLLPLCPTSPT